MLKSNEIWKADFTDTRSGRLKRIPPVSANAKPRIKKERRFSRTGAETRDKLLDAAEQMFADHGYDGTSLRDIAVKANLHLALSSYHFGSKERLFDEVIGRRAIEMERIRLDGLARIDPQAQSTSETVRLMIEAYVFPMIQARYGTSRQWQAHVRLMAGLVNVKRWTPLVGKHYDRCAHIYIDRWRELLPDAKTNSLYNAFSFMVVTMMYVCSYPDRFGSWKKKPTSRKAVLKTAIEDLVRFIHAGFMSLTHSAVR